MRQYTPLPGMTGSLSRKLTDGEYQEVVDYALAIGADDLILQEKESVGEGYIPDFETGEENGESGDLS